MAKSFVFLLAFFMLAGPAIAQDEVTTPTIVQPDSKPQIQCHGVPAPVVSDSKGFSDTIDGAFGGIVNVLSKVLFWDPISFVTYGKDGQPIIENVNAKNKNGKTFEQVALLIQADPKPKYSTKGVACLNAKGVVQKNAKGQPWLTNWSLTEGQFVHQDPFTQPSAVYPKKADGSFYQKKSKLRVKGSDPETTGIPLVVLVLMIGAIFYTFYYRFANFRLFRHAIDCVRGVFDDPKDPGEVSHFQALTCALSATVGLGNIAGVAVAIGIGGPGAVFWMVLLGLLGMTSKFHECTLGQMYRQIDDEGHVHGGAMYYLSQGFKELGWAGLGKVLGLIFAIFIVGGSFGAGNMFQANQSFKAIAGELPAIANYGWAFGLVLAFLVGLVIIGGIKRIGTVTEKLIPLMCLIYLLAASYIIITHISAVPAVFALIFSKAFSFEAGIGGFVGIAVQGIRRAVFSNEAGSGSAAVAHSCAKTAEPVREGIVSLLEPFIDTVVICTMTAFVVLVTGVYDNPMAGEGVEMTRYAFGLKLSWFPTVLSICVIMFAFSTMISWSYYGERGWTYLFGKGKPAVLVYRILFLFFVVFGCTTSLGNVLDFSDFMFLAMAFPNILGGIWLSGKVKAKLDDYTAKLKAGEFVRYK